MRLRERIKEARRFIAFAFYPKNTLILCMVFSAVVVIILAVVMCTISSSSVLYNVFFALTTGAAGSFFVSTIVELASNYRHNKLAWHELQEYYSAVMNYESCKQIMMKNTPSQRAEQKAYDEFIAAGGIDEFEELNKPKDVIEITWGLLPELIPVLKKTIEEKKEFLSDEEITELKNILSDYEQIQFEIKRRILEYPMAYDALNHPDEDYLKSFYPADVLKNMVDWVKKSLASKESQKACDRYAEAILADSFLLSQFMRDYDISQRGIDNYQDELDKMEDEEYEPEDIDYDELDFSQPDDEEVFRSEIEEYYMQSELENRPFVSWHISTCCLNISESMNNLEKSILKKPFYGMMIEHLKDSAEKPIDDIVSQISYESEKRQLDKRLEKQKSSAKEK